MSVAEMVRLYNAGYSLRDIGWKANYSHTAVRDRLLAAGVTMRPRSRPRSAAVKT